MARVVARDNVAMFERHPWLVEQPLGRPAMGPGVIRKYERELQSLEGIGLTDLEMDASLALVLGHAHGVAMRSLSAARAERETGLDDQAWWGAVGPVLEQVIREPLPVSARVGTNASIAHRGVEAADHGFAFGLERILDGIEVLLRPSG